MSIEYFECACHSPDHRLVFQLEEYDGQPELFTEVHLSSRGFFGRLWVAIKYIFGYKCRYGCFDCFLMKPEDATRFQLLLDVFVIKHNEWVKRLKNEK